MKRSRLVNYGSIVVWIVWVGTIAYACRGVGTAIKDKLDQVDRIEQSINVLLLETQSRVQLLQEKP